MQKRIGMSLAVAAVVGLAGCSMFERKEAPPPPPAPVMAAAPTPTPVVSGTISEGLVTASATVQSIDLKKRVVTLKGPDGTVESFDVGPQVHNLDKVKKGDQVVITYYESVGYQVQEAGGAAQPGVSVSADVGRAQPGQRPGAVGARSITVTTTIDKIDRATNVVTLRGPDGTTDEVHVQDPSKLAQVKVGDLVQITYTEALAVSVEPAPKSKKKKWY